MLRRTGLLPALKALPKLKVPASPWGIPRIGDDLSEQTFAIGQVGPERLGLIRSYAREMGVTVNDVLLTAFCRSLFTICDPPLDRPLRVEVPINLRRYLPGGQAGVIGDLSGVYFLAIERKDNESFEGTLQRVHREMDKKKKNRTELAELLLLELLLLPGIFLMRRLRRPPYFQIAHPVISNLGVIDPEAADFGSVPVEDVQMIGPTLYPPNVGLGASTFRQRMTLSSGYCNSATDAKIMGRLLDLILDELPG